MKPSKVIYVVNRPAPGHNKGDWVVRMHGKILSRHKLKNRAVKKARIEARKRNFTYMVQRTDGTFEYGHHPIP